MAATDKHYRDQRTLDVVFALSCLAMLGALVWMFVQDYYGEWKTEQRVFYDVKAEMAMRQALEQMPDPAEIEAAEAAVVEARQNRDEDKIAEAKRKIAEAQPKKEKAEANFQSVKSYLESRMSFYNIAKENNNTALMTYYEREVDRLNRELEKAQAERDMSATLLRERQNEVIELEKPLNEALLKSKSLNDKFDSQIRLAVKTRYGLAHRIRSFWILEAFASPYKIHQITNDNVPIDYNFKYVTRFDRCQTCHQGIDNPAFTREALNALREEVPAALEEKLDRARKLLEKRRESVKGLREQLRMLPDPNDLRVKTLPSSRLSDARVTEFCAHPRLDLYVGPNSKHPAERFGCSACHSGQGSATSFVLASHTPNDSQEKQRWQKEYHWHYEQHHGTFLWDFPMLPKRFIESSCLKCHHQVTDLITSDNRNEAPKLLRGYHLIKENGCFGCHEVGGRKGGRQVGPDIRLEPYPPRDVLSPNEVLKLDADPENAPGHMRKVGPSLFRLTEKTNPEWTAKWIRAPREFRPDTKMPHFYGTSNNHPKWLPDEQKKFPDAEIYAVTDYLFRVSRDHLRELADSHKQAAQDAQLREQIDKKLQTLQLETEKLTDAQKKEQQALQKQLEELAKRDALRRSPPPLDLTKPPPAGNAERGRFLFTVKGCLACHTHHAVETASGKPGSETYLPGVISEASFGPDLSQIAAKLGTTAGGAKSARIWLAQWIQNPHAHSPRSRMPVTHMSPTEAADIAEWLLTQKPAQLGAGWNSKEFWGNGGLKIEAPDVETLKGLTRVYLSRLLPKDTIDNLESGPGDVPQVQLDGLPQEEQALVKELRKIHADPAKKADRYEDRLMQYVGKKAVGRLGCYGCHDIPGFETAKPIGVNLQDWGKKDPERLAFEDIKNFINRHYHIVPKPTDQNGQPYPIIEENGIRKLPYEQFYKEMVFGHRREGYLNQKILDPRSYDYGRKRTWDDLARMPEFRLTRGRRMAGESPGAYEARLIKEEAEAREAVNTFVLGLVAEPVPEKSINRPTGDRLAEVEGRKILDKYNCASCHVVREGVVDFKMDSKTRGSFDTWYKIGLGSWAEDHAFLSHKNWQGKLQTGDKLTVRGVNLRVEKAEDEDDPKAPKQVKVRLTEALTYGGPDGTRTIRANALISVPVTELVYPSRAMAEDPDALRRFLRDEGQYGGAFTDLLVDFLVERDAKKGEAFYKRDPNTGLASEAVSAAPPILIGQGERTQPDWLEGFLRDPMQIRRMTEFTHGRDTAILRMPKFNMSPEEAKALVNYFAAVERLTNSGTGLTNQFDNAQLAEGFRTPYWLHRNKEYVDRLKATTKDPDGKPILDAKGKEVKNLYVKRQEELKPVWDKIAEDAKAKHKEVKARHEEAQKRLKAAVEAADKEKDKATDATKREQIEATRVEAFWKAELDRADDDLKHSTIEEQEAAWREREAYVVDAYRIVVDSTCMKCHQIGHITTNNQVQGPPLHKVHQRLRPEWVQRWLANPKRLIYYTPMPLNFPANANNFAFFPGTSFDQLTAARDMLMVYPQAAALPVNRYWVLPLPGGEKK